MLHLADHAAHRGRVFERAHRADAPQTWSNFYISPTAVARAPTLSRAAASVEALRKQNPMVTVDVLAGALPLAAEGLQGMAKHCEHAAAVHRLGRAGRAMAQA
jgi:hypothetical protein